MTNLLDKKEAAKLLGVSPRTIDRMRAVGALKAVKLPTTNSRSIRFEPNEIDRLVSKNREK